MDNRQYMEPEDKTKVESILADPCTSYWLKDAIKAILDRDCMDAISDVEVLLEVANNVVKPMRRRKVVSYDGC